MYIWARITTMMARARGKGRVPLGASTERTFRCWPSDVDNYMHMNNARYMAIADVGRIELFFRTGMWDLGKSRNWWPMMGGGQITYVKEIKLWQKFRVVSSFETWEDKQLLGLHRFVLEDGVTSAVVRTTVGVYDFQNRRYVPIEQLAAAVGVNERPREPDQGEVNFMRSNADLRAMARPATTG
jgi:acyl-CoA thioesterase FadM